MHSCARGRQVGRAAKGPRREGTAALFGRAALTVDCRTESLPCGTSSEMGQPAAASMARRPAQVERGVGRVERGVGRVEWGPWSAERDVRRWSAAAARGGARRRAGAAAAEVAGAVEAEAARAVR